MKKHFYGILFLGGNRSCTTGEPNNKTGRLSIACDIFAFNTKKERNDWVNKENLYIPSGCGGGERIKVRKKYLRSYSRGMSLEEYNRMIENLHWECDFDNE